MIPASFSPSRTRTHALPMKTSLRLLLALAAATLPVFAPALSAQIRKLEDALGLVLFERTSRRVMATPGGEAVARQARVVLAEARKLLAIAQREQPDALAGRLALGAIQTLGPYLFPAVLRPLRLAGAMKVAEGVTTLEEVLRATPAWE